MLILSDTHGDEHLNDASLPRVDVVLHCGDLTNDSQPAELEKTLAMLRAFDAPLKLAFPGNHDFGLEPGYWRRTRAHGQNPARQEGQDKYGISLTQTNEAAASWDLLRRSAHDDRTFLLPQGMHTFVLGPVAGGARLRLFSSPLTPRRGNWGFQYDRSNPQKWGLTIPTTRPTGNEDEDGAVDVVMTHGPPRGIRDGTGMGMGHGGGAAPGAGCAGLLAAVERARPRLHCFGHIHIAWGAELVTWKREMVMSDTGTAAFLGASAPIYSNLVDTNRSRIIASVLPAGRHDTDKTDRPPARTTAQCHHSPPREEGSCCAIDISPDGGHPVERGAQTLFVNAAVQLQSRPSRM